MNRTLLVRSTVACAAFGVVFVMIALAGTLRPSAMADASLPRIDIGELQPGQAELRDCPWNGKLFAGFRWSVLLLKHSDGNVSAWNVPTIDGKVGLPDSHWWLPFYACARFGLVDSHDGQRHFACSDANLPSEYWRQEWQWSETGEALGQSTDDMPATVGFVEGRYFVFGKRN
jgi:hypothetical protein